jgi:hypothetical protein
MSKVAAELSAVTTDIRDYCHDAGFIDPWLALVQSVKYAHHNREHHQGRCRDNNH